MTEAQRCLDWKHFKTYFNKPKYFVGQKQLHYI